MRRSRLPGVPCALAKELPRDHNNLRPLARGLRGRILRFDSFSVLSPPLGLNRVSISIRIASILARLISSASDRGRMTSRINIPQQISDHVHVAVQAGKCDRISTHEPPQRRAVEPRVVVVESEPVEVLLALARVPDVRRPLVARHPPVAAERPRRPARHDGAGGVGDRQRAAQVVGEEERRAAVVDDRVAIVVGGVRAPGWRLGRAGDERARRARMPEGR